MEYRLTIPFYPLLILAASVGPGLLMALLAVLYEDPSIGRI